MRWIDVLRANRLYLVVAFTGAAVLAVETLAFRVLAPYFGNTIYSFSSVVTVVLGALSLGYLHGGVLADRVASYRQFFVLIAAGGGATLIFFTLAQVLLPMVLSWVPSLVWGPLVGAALVFFIPAYVLGMLSPYAIALIYRERPEVGIGHVAGRTFAFSTAGSIVGSVGTGFFLIPYVSISTSLIAISLSLMLLGMVGLVSYARVRPGEIALIIIVAGASTLMSVAVGTTPSSVFVSGDLVFAADGRYERIAIYDTTLFNQPTRLLLLDRSYSSGINPLTGGLVFPYTRYIELYTSLTPAPEHMLVLGGGAATVGKVVYDAEAQVNVDVVDVEPLLPELSREYFGVPDSPRLTYHTDDARRFLLRGTTSYDVIFGDVYSSIYSIPSHVMTEEFFTLVRERLSPDGMFLLNVIATLEPYPESLLYSSVRTLEEVFPSVTVFAVTDPSSYRVQNIMLLALPYEPASSVADMLRDGDGRSERFADNIVPIDHLDLTRYTSYTDNFVPVERHNALMLARDGRVDPSTFKGLAAYGHVRSLMALGPRYPGSQGRSQAVAWLTQELSRLGIAEVTTQPFTATDSHGRTYSYTNVIGRINPGVSDRVLLGSHFDTKKFADRDPNDPTAPVPGANDGSSGVAVLLELASIFAQRDMGIDVVFFDGEEGFPHDGEVWVPLGSSHFVENLDAFYPTTPPRLVIVPDMVCEHGVMIPAEESSHVFGGQYYESFLEHATQRYPDHFTHETTYRISDDHTPFGEAGIPAFLIIDFDYPEFHTTEDTLEQCSPSSLMVVGSTIETYLEQLAF